MIVLLGWGKGIGCFVTVWFGGVGLDRGAVSVCEELRGCGMGCFVGSGMGIGFNVDVVVFGVAGVVLGVDYVVLVVLFDVSLFVGLVASGIGRAVGLVGSVVITSFELILISATGLAISPETVVVTFLC